MKIKPLLILSFALTSYSSATNFDSIANGNWETPANWNPGTVPNTYGADSVTVSGDNISYNGVGTTFPGGNLVVANGNSITVDAGTLTQIWAPGAPPPFGTAIGIGVSGSTSGAGTLTINNAGVVDTGTANVLAVGATVAALGGAPGNGTVNINDGTLRIGAGAGSLGIGAQGLAVGVDTGATGIINVGDGAGAGGSAILDLSTNNAILTLGTLSTSASGGTGTMIIGTDGVVNQGTGGVTVGGAAGIGILTLAGGAYNSTAGILTVANGGTGTLNLNGGTLTSAAEVRVGIAAGGNGTFKVAGGTANITGETNIGRNASGNGTLDVSSGAANVANLFVGRDTGTGTLKVSGGTVTATGDINLGRDGGTGTATISGGITSGLHAVLGFGAGATGTLNISNGSFGSTDYFNVGHDGGVGMINQTGGTVSFGGAGWMAIGLGGGPVGSKYDMSGGNLNSPAGVEVGADREASMNISGTANVAVGSISVGVRANSDGLLTQSGGTVVTGNVIVGGAQGTTGQKGVYNKTGGDLTTTNMTVGTNGGLGTFTLTGGAITNVGTNANNENGLFIAARQDHGSGGGATGTVNINNGTMNMSGWMEIGSGAGSVGALNVTGSNSVFNATGSKDLQVGYNGGNGRIDITAGGKLNQNWWINVARGGGSTGSVLVDGAGSTLTKTGGRLVIGEDGNGTLMVQNAGQVLDNSNDRFMVGKNTGGVGIATITGAGSKYQKNGGEIWVGGDDDGADAGNGTLNVINNGVFNHVSGAPILIGMNGGTGTVNVNTGGVLTRDMNGTNSGDVLLGGGGNGSVGNLNITAGGKVNNNWWTVISDNDTATGTVKVDGAGSQLNIGPTDQRLVVGRSGQGFLEVTNGGEINATTGEMHVGMWGGDGALPAAKGTVTVDTGGKINGQTNASAADPGARGGMRLFLGTDKRNFGPTDGKLIMKDGSVSVQSFTVGNNGMATVSQTGGTVNVNQWTEIGQERDPGTHRPVYNISGGTLNTQSLSVGQRRNGAMNMSGGIVNVGSNGTVTTNYWGGFAVGNAGPTEDGGSHGDGIFNQSGGTLNLTEEANIGNQGGTKGIWNLSGGTVNFQVGDRRIHVGRRGDGLMKITGGTITGMQGFNVGAEAAPGGNPATKGILTIELDNPAGVIQAGDLYVGYGNRPTSGQTTGTVNINQGTLRTDGWTEIGRGGAVDGATVGGKGTVNVTGPSAKWEHSLGATADVQIGYEGGIGSLNIQDGGTVNHNWWINVARGATSKGTIIVENPGSTLNIVGSGERYLNVGEDGNGTLNVVDEGMVNTTDAPVVIARNGGSVGTVNLATGGIIKAPSIGAGGGAASLNIDDGKIIATANQTNYFPGLNAANSEIGSGGLTFDTQGFTVTAGNVMDGDGGITKVGIGTLVLSAANLFAGDVNVEKGTLELNGSVNGGVNLATGTLLTGTGTIELNVSLTGGIISPGGSGGTGVGTHIVGGDVTLDAASYYTVTLNDETAGMHDQIDNVGMFSANGGTLNGTFTDTDFVYGLTRYPIVTGPVDSTTFGNASLLPAAFAAAWNLPVGAQGVTVGGQQFYLERGSFTLIPIPEPSTVLVGLASFALLGLRRRR